MAVAVLEDAVDAGVDLALHFGHWTRLQRRTLALAMGSAGAAWADEPRRPTGRRTKQPRSSRCHERLIPTIALCCRLPRRHRHHSRLLAARKNGWDRRGHVGPAGDLATRTGFTSQTQRCRSPVSWLCHVDRVLCGAWSCGEIPAAPKVASPPAQDTAGAFVVVLCCCRCRLRCERRCGRAGEPGSVRGYRRKHPRRRTA